MNQRLAIATRIMRHLFLVIVLLPLLASAQSREDSLQNLLKILPESEHDTVYYLLGKDAYFAKNDQSLHYFQESLKYSKLYNNHEIHIRSLLGIGIIYKNSNRLDSAELILKRAIDKSEEFQIDHRLPWIYEGLGLVYLNKNEYENAINTYFQAIKAAEKYKINQSIIGYYNQIGLVEMRLGNYNNALKAFKESLKIHSSDSSRLPILKINMAICHVNLGNIDEGKRLINELMIHRKKEVKYYDNSRMGIVVELHRLIGKILLIENNFDSARYHLFRSLDQINDHTKDDYSTTLLEIGFYFQTIKKSDSAIFYYKKALQYAKSFNDPTEISFITKKLAEIYYLSGEYETATSYFDNALALEDSIRDIRQKEKIHASYLDFEEYKTSKLLEAKETIITRNRQLAIFLAVATLLAITTLFFAYKNARTRKRLNERLSDRVFERTKDLNSFLYRTSHDLAGPIATLKGLMKLIESGHSRDEIREYLERMKLTAGKMEKIIQKLENISSISARRLSKEKHQILTIARNVVDKVKNGSELEPQISLSGNAEAKVDDALLTGILENLLENSYNNIDKREANQEIIIDINNNHNLSIRITDTGTGIIDGQENKIFDLFFSGYDRSEHTGIGLYYARVAAERMGGSLLLRNKRKPTVFEVKIPLKGSPQ